jgi:uncharacterized protein (TIGR02246 family)
MTVVRCSAMRSIAGGFLLLLTGTATAQDAAVGFEARIAALEAREEIRELIHTYGSSLDARDFRTFAELFAEQDGTWIGGFGEAVGREAIFALMDSRICNAEPPMVPVSHHVISNIQLEVDGDQASGTTKWIFVVPAADETPQWLLLGHYRDQFVRRDGRWYFLRREAFQDIPARPNPGP